MWVWKKLQSLMKDQIISKSAQWHIIGHFWSLNGPLFVFSRAWFHPGWVWNPGKRPFCFRKCICPGRSSSGSGLVDRALAQEFPGACMGVRVYQEVFFVQHGEDSGIGSSKVSNAFCEFLHGVLINMRILVQFLEILHDLEPLALLLRNTENGGIEQWIGSPDNSEF